jgi:esterase/lipase superfamily enzyme
MKFHSYPRAGFAGPPVKLVPGVETIDASAVDSSLIGHFYYGESRSVVADLYALLKTWTPAAARKTISAVVGNGGTFWRLLPGIR